MAFTGKLGSFESTLANIELAAMGGNNHSAQNLITFTHLARGFNGNKIVNQTITFAHTVDPDKIYSRSLTSTLGLFTTNAVHRLTLASNTITFSGTATASKSIGIYQTIALTHSATHQYTPHFETVQQVFTINQSVAAPLVRPRSVSNTVTFTGTAVGARVKNIAVSNLFVVSHVASNVKILKPSNTITFVGTATNVRVLNRSLVSNLVLAHTVARQVMYVRSLTSTLVFPAFHTKNGQQVPSATYSIPKQYVKMSYQSRVIILPVPLLNDTEGLTGELKIKRTTNGGTFTYVRKNLDRKLKYDFTINRDKAFELRSYVDLTVGKSITLQNWKGEIWVGYITNNPFDFATEQRAGPCGERFAVTVEFDGVRIH